MSLNKLQNIAKSITKSMDDNEKFMSSLLAGKLGKLAQKYPEDRTIVRVASLMDKFADKNLFISRRDFRDLYGAHYGVGTRFAEFFPTELGELPKGSDVVVADAMPEKVLDLSDNTSLAREMFDAALSGNEFAGYSQASAQKALKEVGYILDAWNISARKLAVDAGNEKFLVIKADYDTPKGITSFYIPVEITEKGSVIEPSLFLTNDGIEKLNNQNIKNYITKSAGTKLYVSAKKVLGVIEKAASNRKEISNVELAVMKLREKNATQLFGEQVFVQDDNRPIAQKDLEMPKSDAFSSFEEQFASPSGAANFEFGADVVNNGRNIIATRLKDFGFKNAQIKVAKSKKDKLFYAVSLGHTAFVVPMKLENKKFASPSFMLCNDELREFTQEQVQDLNQALTSDTVAGAVVSPMYGLKPSELVSRVEASMIEGNLAKAEDALKVLKATGDAASYKLAFNYFMTGLTQKKQAKSECSMQLKTANSVHKICGHTGLPLNKVHQDKFGQCVPNYHKNVVSTGETLNQKILGK